MYVYIYIYIYLYTLTHTQHFSTILQWELVLKLTIANSYIIMQSEYYIGSTVLL